MWVAYAAFALAHRFGALALLCPTAMLYLLLRVTGVPLAEAQALRSRGSDYMRYQQTTNASFHGDLGHDAVNLSQFRAGEHRLVHRP